MNIFSDWRFLILCFVVAAGIWGFLLKVIMRHLDWKTTMCYVWCAVFVFYALFIFRKVNLGFNKYHILAIITGIISGIGTIAFYKAMSLKAGSIIVPLSAQYIVITVLLSLYFLKEPVSLRIILGIFFSIVSIILLT